jgi:hypothetical protein
MKNLRLHTYVILALLTVCLASTTLPAATISSPSHQQATSSDDTNDTTAPVTDIIIEGSMQGGVYISNVTVSFNATDDLSGVNATYFSMDSLNFTRYDTPFNVTGDGQYTITYYSIDNAGNQETPKNTTFSIILIGPVTINITGGIGPIVTITNIGTKDLVNIPFSIALDNGIYLYGQYRNGTISIPVGASKIVRSFVLGLGEPTILVTVGQTQATMNAFVFGFLVIKL